MNNFSIPVEALDYIHQWLPFEAGDLYPFGFENGSVSGRLEAMLTKGQFLSEDGKITEHAKETFRVVSDSKKTAKLRFLADGDLLDFQVFFPTNGGNIVSFKRGQNAFFMENPAPTNEIIDVLADFSGTGKFGVIQSGFILTGEESLVLAAIIDLIRRKIFLSLGKDENSFDVKMSADELNQVFAREDLGATWLVWAINSFLPEEMKLENVNISASLSGLVEKKLVKKENEEIIPSEEVVYLSRRLLHLNCLYMLDTFELKENNEAMKSRLSVIQNGIRDILLLETDGREIAWKGISGEVLFSILHGVFSSLNQQDKVEAKAQTGSSDKKAPKAPPPPPAEALEKCPECGSKLKPGAKFCSKCGETI